MRRVTQRCLLQVSGAAAEKTLDRRDHVVGPAAGLRPADNLAACLRLAAAQQDRAAMREGSGMSR
jgi:hypothetical protein